MVTTRKPDATSSVFIEVDLCTLRSLVSDGSAGAGEAEGVSQLTLVSIVVFQTSLKGCLLYDANHH